MPSLKVIRKRIASVKSTQKITRAMKMVAAARLRRAQQRITELRPFAVKTGEILASVASRVEPESHPLLARRDEHDVLIVVASSDRGLAGAFNSNINRATERKWKELVAEGKTVRLMTIGRKARDYFKRRGADILLELPGANEKMDLGKADEVAAQIIDYFVGSSQDTAAEPAAVEKKSPRFDAVYFVFNEFKSAMTQLVQVQRLLPVVAHGEMFSSNRAVSMVEPAAQEYLYEPNKSALLDRLLPLYVQINVFRGLLESVASEHGARMSAMDSATNNAKEMISKLTLDYNRARQAAITKELMEIIGGAEALK